MSARSFRSVFMVASCAGAALGCYLVSLRVASERAALEDVETEIVLAQRDIRLLQTEIGTRGRLAQLERWNARVLALSAPSADQFLEGGFQLARLARPERKIQLEAPIVLAAAPAPQPRSTPLEDVEPGAAGLRGGPAPSDLMHQASLKRPVRDAVAAPGARLDRPDRPEPATEKLASNDSKPAAKSGKPAKAKALARDKVDPLAPLPVTKTAARETGPAR